MLYVNNVMVKQDATMVDLLDAAKSAAQKSEIVLFDNDGYGAKVVVKRGEITTRDESVITAAEQAGWETEYYEDAMQITRCRLSI